MKISLRNTLPWISLLCAIFMYYTPTKSIHVIVTLSILTLIVAGYTVVKTDQKRLLYSSVLLMYVYATQFGLVIPYVLFGENTVSAYPAYTLRFLNSEWLNKALILGNVATLSLLIGAHISKRKKTFEWNEFVELNGIDKWENKTYRTGIILLVCVLMFFVYHILTGGMKLFSTYETYMQSKAYNSSLYSYILILFYVGTIYIASAGDVMKHKPGWIIWLLVSLIFAINGNKGEFLYAILAVLGMKGVAGKKISKHTVILILVIVLVLIPLITSLRSIGIVENLSKFSFNPFGAFSEMGMQIRTSVYTLESMNAGDIDFLYGKSYYQPIINILTPFASHSVATAKIREMLPGMGYNQVIESYANFGLFGVLLFFSLMGYILGRKETSIKNKPQLALWGTVTCILINATRNYFAFVPGQILLVAILYFITSKINIGLRIDRHAL